MDEPISATRLQQSLLTLAVDSWRFTRIFSRALSKLGEAEAVRFESQLRYYLHRLEEAVEAAGVHLVNLEGMPYDPGVAATAVNIADFSPDDTLFIDQMVEPIFMGSDGVKREGLVILGKVDS